MDKDTWDYSVFWKEALTQLRTEVSEQEWVMWFNNLEYECSDAAAVTICVPSSFYRDQIQQRYSPRIEKKLMELSGNQIAVEFEVNTADLAAAEVVEAPAAPVKKTTKKKASSPVAAAPKKPHSQLRSDYIFENFVIGVNNSFAANAAYAITKNPGTAYNPCLIYGGVGLGKTHLIQSIGNAVYAESSARIVYVTAETFTNEFIQSIKDKRNHQFKSKYRSVDVLLVDDIHFLQNKTETQEELFHTFNALYDAHKQMAFTCDRPVSELKHLTDRLRSRFERGLNVDLQPPDFETRFAIMKRKVEEKKVPLPDEVIDLVCKNITTNVRDLEASLTKLIAYSDLVDKQITVEVVQQQLRDVFSNPRQSNITIEMIQRVVAEYFALSAGELKGKKRTKAIAFPRQIAMHIVRDMTEYSTTEVGLEFGGRDHTTVMHACQRVESRMKTDPTLEPTINHLVRTVKENNARA